MNQHIKQDIINSFNAKLNGPDVSATTFFAECLIFLSRVGNCKEFLHLVATMDKQRISVDDTTLNLERNIIYAMIDMVTERGRDTIKKLEPFASKLDNAHLNDFDRKLLFDNILDTIRSKGDHSSQLGRALQPKSVTTLATWLIKQYKSSGDVYNPFAGISEYAVSMGKNFVYIGHEANPYIYILGKINMSLNLLPLDTNFSYNFDVFDKWTSQPKEVIITTPPWGEQDVDGCYIDTKTLLMGIDTLNPTGIMLIILPTSTVKYADQQRLIWEDYIEKENLVDTIISLPKRLFNNSVTPTTMLLIRRGRKPNDPIRMLNASLHTIKDESGTHLNCASAIEAFANKDSRSYVELSHNDLALRDFVLSPEYHIALNSQQKGRKTVLLKDIASVPSLPSLSLDPNKNIPTITLNDLHDHPYKGAINTKNLSSAYGPIAQIDSLAKLVHSAVLVAINGPLRPTICHASAQFPAAIDSATIMAIKPIDEKVDLDFLAYELSIAQNISTSIDLTKNDIEHHIMYIPTDLYSQHQIFEEARRATQDAIMRDNDLEHRTTEKINDFKLLERTRRHNISTYIANTTMGYVYLSNELEKLSSLVQKNDEALAHLRKIIDLSKQNNAHNHVIDILDDAQKRRAEILQKLTNISNSVSVMKSQFHVIRDMINKFGSEDAFEKASVVSLDYMLSSDEHEKPNGRFSIELHKDVAAFGSKEVFIKTSKFDFLQLYNNIVGNAYRHGFGMKNSPKNIIRISWRPTDDNRNVEITFDNNGAPLPASINKETYGREGETAGSQANTGHGGSYVKKFVEHFGGDYDVIRHADGSEFVTTIKIILPIEKTV